MEKTSFDESDEDESDEIESDEDESNEYEEESEVEQEDDCDQGYDGRKDDEDDERRMRVLAERAILMLTMLK